MPVARRGITRRYRIMLWSFTLLAIALILLTHRQEFLLLEIPGYYCAMAVAHRRALTHALAADSTVEVNLARSARNLSGRSSRDVGPAGVSGHSRAVGLAPLESFAGALSGPLGNPWSRSLDRAHARRSLRFACVGRRTEPVLRSVGVGILYWSRRTSARCPAALAAAEERRFRRINVQAYLFFACFRPCKPGLSCCNPVDPGVAGGRGAAHAAVYYFLLIRNRPRLSTRAGDHTPDVCWKLGIFYFNPADPAVFVLQRFGLGYTFNFGNRWSWAAMGTLAAAISLRVVLR